jgi:hypothetical protein
MEKILIFIKHHFTFLWRIIEFANGYLFSLFYKSRMGTVLQSVFKEVNEPPFSYRCLNLSDAESLEYLINSQKSSDLEYFKPHGFDIHSIRKQFNNPSFLMMGAFDGSKMAGYFFLRFFANRKCFVGRLIDENYRGKGMGPVMNRIMYETSWRMGFRCLSTISRNNTAVIRAHAKNPGMVVLKDLPNDYLLVEFIRQEKTVGNK